MATETKLEQHLRLRERRPAITRPEPVVNHLIDGLEEISAFSERVTTLLGSVADQLHDDCLYIEGTPKRVQDLTYNVWLILRVCVEKTTELDTLIKAAVERAYADSRAAAA